MWREAVRFGVNVGENVVARFPRTTCWKVLAVLLLGCSAGESGSRTVTAVSGETLLCSTAEQCLRDCSDGAERACARLGDMFAYGVGGAPSDAERARALWQLACDGGDQDACTSLSQAAFRHGELDASLLYGAKACAAGEVAGCTQLGVHAFLGQATDRNQARARTLWEHACRFDDAEACSYLGLLEFAHSPVQARARFERACDASNRAGCTALGLSLELGLGGRSDFKEALRVYLAGCESGRPSACVYAGLLIEENSGRVEHLRRAAQLYELGCEVSTTELCWVDEDDVLRWRRYYAGEAFTRRACDGAGTHALACFNAALAHERGLFGAIEADRAQTLLDESCREGFSRACRDAATYVVH